MDRGSLGSRRCWQCQTTVTAQSFQPWRGRWSPMPTTRECRWEWGGGVTAPAGCAHVLHRGCSWSLQVRCSRGFRPLSSPPSSLLQVPVFVRPAGSSHRGCAVIACSFAFVSVCSSRPSPRFCFDSDSSLVCASLRICSFALSQDQAFARPTPDFSATCPHLFSLIQPVLCDAAGAYFSLPCPSLTS